MINKGEWQTFEDELASHEDLTLEQKYRILDGLYEEARGLGLFPSTDPLEGLDVDIRIAKAVNSVSKAA
ncbi:MAG: hypothetical protein WC956_10965 [bacterium]